MTEPLLGIAFVTYKRTDLALLSIQSVSEKLIYPKDKRAWFINDDGSPQEHVDAIKNLLLELGENLMFINTERFGGKTYSCGKGWNLALEKAHQFSEIIMFLEDDWSLKEPLDISSYVQLLIDREDVGMVRLGGLATGSNVDIVGHKGLIYLNYSKSCPYAYSGNPSLRHTRFTKAYGWYTEEGHPGIIELHYDTKFRTIAGPEIWRPAEMTSSGIFAHLGVEKSFTDVGGIE